MIFFRDLLLTEQSNKTYNRCPKCVPNKFNKDPQIIDMNRASLLSIMWMIKCNMNSNNGTHRSHRNSQNFVELINILGSLLIHCSEVVRRCQM